MTGSRTPRRIFAIYVIAVLCLTLVGGAAIESADDASIGGGLLLGLVALAGLPWSAAVFLADDGLKGGVASAFLYALLAVLNAVLLLGLAQLLSRRRAA